MKKKSKQSSSTVQLPQAQFSCALFHLFAVSADPVSFKELRQWSFFFFFNLSLKIKCKEINKTVLF